MTALTSHEAAAIIRAQAAELAGLKAELERIKQNHGCAREQRTTQFCQEAQDLRAKLAGLEAEHAKDSAGLYFQAKLEVREIWNKHLGPHKCDIDGVDKFLAELEAWMTQEASK